jgi:XRE family aerobic/anaerobic benzoate catabolism transcriptional regulator
MSGPDEIEGVRLLERIGERLRSLRQARGLSRKELAQRAGLSLRFLAQVETGHGNIAVTRLARLARALDTGLAALVSEFPSDPAERLPLVALVGLRGAGKSSLGASTAEILGLPFHEHDARVEEEAGMSLGELFGLHGDVYYRRVSAVVLRRFLDGPDARGIMAASGGVVADEGSWRLLRDRAHTVWLQARPADHWGRVVAQGDSRPMRHRPGAMDELRRLLSEREPLYALAEHRIVTSGRSWEQARDALVALTRRLQGVTVTA